jgi:murein DD-endopeptidase MepM/ murein hydrolase activator NlpD
MRGSRMLVSVTYFAAALLGVFSISWASASDHEATIRTPVPKRWMPRTSTRCKFVKGARWKMCDGPRRTPEPFGAAANDADALGLGTLEVGRKLLRDAPKPEWVAAVKGHAQPTLLWPIEQGRFGRGFGYVRKERRSLRHNGVDVGAKVGELVRSLNDGIVAYSDNQIKGFGNTVVVVHKDKTVSFYCHLQANYLFAGQQVRRGQVVGEVGLTGITRGPHLHFEWHQGGEARDPMARMVGQPTRQRASMVDFDESTPLSI